MTSVASPQAVSPLTVEGSCVLLAGKGFLKSPSLLRALGEGHVNKPLVSPLSQRS